jgi:hypothetical protein
MKVFRIFSIFILACALMLTACASSDTTKVTVYFAKNGQASLEPQKLPLIDRIFNLFSSKAYAQHHISANTDYYFVWVTADDIDTINSPMVPGTESSVSFEVQNGDNRVFTVLSLHGSYYNYIGQAVANLTGGNTSVPVDMYPCLNNITANQSGSSISIFWTYDPTLVSPEGFSTFSVYRACYGDDPACNGTVSLILTGQPIAITPPISDSNGLVTGGNPQEYYYFLSINSPYSPGGTGIPHPGNLIDFFNNYHFISIYMMGVCSYNPGF